MLNWAMNSFYSTHTLRVIIIFLVLESMHLQWLYYFGSCSLHIQSIQSSDHVQVNKHRQLCNCSWSMYGVNALYIFLHLPIISSVHARALLWEIILNWPHAFKCSAKCNEQNFFSSRAEVAILKLFQYVCLIHSQFSWFFSMYKS